MCFIMGNESKGVSREVIALADEKIVIPMNENAESINVSVATGILLYEAYKQRVKILWKL